MTAGKKLWRNRKAARRNFMVPIPRVGSWEEERAVS